MLYAHGIFCAAAKSTKVCGMDPVLCAVLAEEHKQVCLHVTLRSDLQGCSAGSADMRADPGLKGRALGDHSWLLPSRQVTVGAPGCAPTLRSKLPWLFSVLPACNATVIVPLLTNRVLAGLPCCPPQMPTCRQSASGFSSMSAPDARAACGCTQACSVLRRSQAHVHTRQW